MKKNYVVFACCIAILAGSLSAFAQAPEGMNYQAIARNASGVILSNQLISIRMTITDGNNGTLLYSETHDTTTNQFGLFTINIGNGVPVSGNFSSISWSSVSPWLQIELDPSGGSAYVSMGSSRLLSVPYALFAASGNQGPAGTQGPQGPQGQQGAAGQQGFPGPQGATGSTGPQGSQGPAGSTGAQGIQGASGSTGPQGPMGPTGPAGSTGSTGATGPAGASGDRYSTTSSSTLTIQTGTQNLLVGTGLNYAVGQTVIIANSATNLMTGTLVSYNSLTGSMEVTVATNSGGGTYSFWNVALNGAPGPAGATGPAGPTGTTGSAGTNGATWFATSGAPSSGTGSVNDLYLNTTNGDYYKKTGASTWTLQANLTGPQGIQGVAGATGSTGTQGPTGPTGSTGASGSTGATGSTGPAGPTGASGTNGATWFTGSGAPSGATGVINDLYINSTNGDYFKKTGASSWTQQGSLKGPTGATGSTGSTGAAGATGASGSPGALWYTGSGAPSGATGMVNDFYLNTSNGDYYKKTGASSWTLQSNLTGPTGATGNTGATGATGAAGATGAMGAAGTNGTTWFAASGVPPGGTGVVNDFYLNTSNGDYYKKTGASSWTLQSNLTGPAGATGNTGAIGSTGAAGATGATGPAGAAGAAGATWIASTGAPSGATGSVNDLYLNTSNGDYYKKTGASTWTLQANLTGQTGATGATGAAGATGATGATGPQGPQGSAGATGAQGPQGATGAAGPQGPQGLQGIQGNTGSTGTTGPSGADGDRYSTSSSSSLTINLGTQNLTVGTGLNYSVGQTLIIANSVSNLMTGTLASYNSVNGAMNVTVSSVTGSGTFSSWEVALNGAPGPAGTTGAQGPAGATGAAGTNGALWYTGSGAPAGATGSINDLFLNTTNGDYYKKTGASTWTLQANLTGPQGLQGVSGTNGATGAQGPTGSTGSTGATGATGATGINGALWFTAAGVPSGATGVINDLYLNTTNGDYYKKTGASTWTLQANLTGPQGIQGSTGVAGAAGATGAQGATGPAGATGANGATWLTGAGAPAGATGVINDLYLNTTNGDYYKKTGASAWTLQANLAGPQGIQGVAGSAGATGAQGPTGSTGASGANGATWFTGAGAPAGATGVINDLYLNTSNGDYHRKTGASAWTLQGNLSGPAGADGATGAAGSQGPAGPAGAAGSANISGTTNYLVKFSAATTGANSIVYDNGTNVGVGLASPLNKLDVSGSIRSSSYVKVDGSDSNNGTINTGSLTFGGVLKEGIASNRTTTDNKFGLDFYTRGYNRMCIDSSGNIGIGLTNPQYILDVQGGCQITGDYIELCQTPDNTSGNVGIGIYSYDNVKLAVKSDQKYGMYVDDATSPLGFALAVNGTAAKTGGGSWSVFSDARLKERVLPYSDGLQTLKKINPVTFHYNTQSGFSTKPEYVGVIAQDLKEVAPYMVSTFSNIKDNEEYYSVDNSAMTYMLINAVKEQQKQIEELRMEIEKLKGKIRD